MNVIYMSQYINPFFLKNNNWSNCAFMCASFYITHESWTIITKPPRKGHTHTKCHNMIASLTTSDLRNTPCGRLKLFSHFCDIWGHFGTLLGFFFSKSWFLLDLLFLRYLSWVFSASKKNPCYFCDFCDICRHFGALIGSLPF